jgi:hypothetical protein
MSRVNNYPEHACVLAKFPADRMLLNPTKVWSNAPLSAQQEKMQLIVVWNNKGKQALNESNLA